MSHLPIVFTGLLMFACGQADPASMPGDAVGGGSPGSPQSSDPSVVGDHFPLSDGATWTYRHTDLLGSIWDEVVDARAATFREEVVYRLSDNTNPTGVSGESVLVRRGSQVLRVHKDVTRNGVQAESVDYDPGFLRWEDAWTTLGTTDWSYTRTEVDAAGVTSIALREFAFTVIATDTPMSVPAGAFQTVFVERVRLDSLETKRYWFAPGVGKVREENVTSGGIEELVSYSIP